MNETFILAIDLKSFYASVECVDRQLNPFITPLVVADKERGQGTIVLAVSPYLKTLGVPSRCRIFALPKVENMIYARPRMSRYIQKSAEVVSIYLDFVAEDDIHVYSIDEAFLDITTYLKAHKCSPVAFAKKIIKRVFDETGLTVTAGIGPNIFLAKVAMDIEAKKNKDFIAQWSKKDVPTKLYPLTPLSKMWGIGARLEERLNSFGFFEVGQLAAASKDFLVSNFGVIGEQLYYHARGEDHSSLREPYTSTSKSLSIGQSLFEDYEIAHVPLLISEMLEDLTFRIRTQHKLASSIGLFIGYSKEVKGGFAKTFKLEQATADYDTLLEAVLFLYHQNISDFPVRKINISAGGLLSDETMQLDLFTPLAEVEKKLKLTSVIDEINNKYGNNSILKASSLLKTSTIKKRHDLIGGHHK